MTPDGCMEMRALWFDKGKLYVIDQRALPYRFEILSLSDHHQVADAIKNMTVRGAPTIGAAAAYGMVLASNNGENPEKAARILKATRPTAYDLFHAVDFMICEIKAGRDPLEAAEEYVDNLVEKCRLIGMYGSDLIKDGDKIMTHCNAGALASVDYGTALAPIREAWKSGKDLFVYVSETRPRLQGTKLTAWELLNEGIPHAIIVDGASGHYMQQGVDLVITGADRIVRNGDFANKIGTFEKALIARYTGTPFYVAAPLSTFDFSIDRGDDIPIEYRGEEEVTCLDGIRVAPENSRAYNPAFDVTPASLVTAFITEKGVFRPDELSRLRGDISE